VITLGGMALILGLMAAGFATAWATRPHLRRYPLTCPDCGKAFVQFGLVLAGRRCDHCHGLAVTESPGEQPGGP
jgi:hypothetical protein